MKKSFKIFILLLVFIGILFAGKNVMAATASITVNKSTITVGDTVTATVKYTAAAWDLKVSADSGLTTSSTTHYANTTETAENESKSFTVKYTANKAGSFKIYLKGNITDEAKTKADSIDTAVSVTVNEKSASSNANNSSSSSSSGSSSSTTTTTKSSNANLSTLGVTPKDYDFSGFSKNKTEYSVTVPKNVDSLKVLYKTADSKATVKVSGNSGFEVGSNNKITVKVTAEDGKTTKTYTIKVTQLAEEEEKPGNLIDKEEELYLKSLSIEGIELSPEFAKDTYSYTATLSDASVNELHVSAEANNEKAKIEISGNTNLVEGNNTINVLVTLEDSSTQAIYQIIVNKEADEISLVITNDEGNSSSNDLISKIKNYAGIAIAVIILVVVAVIVLIVMLIKENKRMKEDDDDEYEVDDVPAEEYNVYKNDENEFKNSEISKDNFIESLYKQRNGNLDEEDLTKQEKETLEEITKQTEKIFEEKVDGQSVEYTSNDDLENSLKIRRNRREKGKHSL